MLALSLFILDVWNEDTLGAPFVPLAEAVAKHDLTLVGDVSGARPGESGKQTLVFSARRPNEPSDIYVASAVLDAQGRVAGLGVPHNLTRSASVDDIDAMQLGDHVLFRSELQGDVVALEVLDLRGEAELDGSFTERTRRAVTNWQQTGRRDGVGRRRYRLDPPAGRVDVRIEGERFAIAVDGAEVQLDPAREKPIRGAEHLSAAIERPAVVAALVPWTVNTVRAWVGPEPIEWLEHHVFGVRDQLQQAYHAVNQADHEAEVAEELALVSAAPQRIERLSVPDPDSGWPPAALPASQQPPVKGEGVWRALVDDPFVRQLPDGSPVFYQTFLRADPQRVYNRIYLTAWDPRQLQLHIVSGTEEPLSATGETGPGIIPRDPKTLGRLVAAFNGGFQAMHGEFGMMADDQVYLPPKPWAATVAVFEDGRVGMGSWPGPEGRERLRGYNEARAVAQIPSDMLSMRQNLTSLVEDGVYNPWQRWWWGAAPKQEGAGQTLTQRSALCLTDQGFMVYAWGDSASPDSLGAALVAARCKRAVHLDMNSGHCGMELYNVLAPGEQGRPYEGTKRWRHEGSLRGADGYTVRARRAVTSMGMPLPRYVRPDSRDFFYLTIKPNLSHRAPGDGFSTADLPHAGWPVHLSRRGEQEVTVLRMDLARLSVQRGGVGSSLAELYGAAPAGEQSAPQAALYGVATPPTRTFRVGTPPEGASVLLRGAPLGPGQSAEAAVGIDGDGFLVYVERVDRRPGDLWAALKDAGVERALALPDGSRMGLRYEEGLLDVRSQQRLRPRSAPTLRFVANQAPAAEVMFPDVKPAPYARWAFLQDQRVRYFRTSTPTARAPDEVLEKMGLPTSEAPPTN